MNKQKFLRFCKLFRLKRILLNFIKKRLGSSIGILRNIFSFHPIYIVSYPKTGRTWLRLLIGKVYCEKYNLSDKDAIHLKEISRQYGPIPIMLTHDNSSWNKKLLKFYQMPTNKNKFIGAKVIFLIRDVRDTLVSCYFQASKRDNNFKGSLSDFIKSESFGIIKILTFYNIWYENRKKPKDFLLLRYEDIHKNPHNTLIKTLNFIGLKNVKKEIIDKAVNFANFNNMQKMERENFFNTDILKPTDITDKETYKVRRGIIGDHISYLNDKDFEYIERVITEMGNPFEK